MKGEWDVAVLHVDPRASLPVTWSMAERRALLGMLLDDEVPDDELDGMLELALSDGDDEEVIDAVLAVAFEDSVSEGARSDVVRDLIEGVRIWEHHPDLRHHRRLYEATSLLHGARPGVVMRPDLLRVQLGAVALDQGAEAMLVGDMSVQAVARLLGRGVPDGILYRLFDDAVDGDRFEDAPHVIWDVVLSEREPTGPAPSIMLTVTGSRHWLAALERVDGFRASTWNDPVGDKRT